MSARIDTTRTLSDDSIEYIINNFESVNLEDAFISGNFEDANDLFQAIEIIETATLIKPEANPTRSARDRMDQRASRRLHQRHTTQRSC